MDNSTTSNTYDLWVKQSRSMINRIVYIDRMWDILVSLIKKKKRTFKTSVRFFFYYTPKRTQHSSLGIVRCIIEQKEKQRTKGKKLMNGCRSIINRFDIFSRSGRWLVCWLLLLLTMSSTSWLSSSGTCQSRQTWTTIRLKRKSKFEDFSRSQII